MPRWAGLKPNFLPKDDVAGERKRGGEVEGSETFLIMVQNMVYSANSCLYSGSDLRP